MSQQTYTSSSAIKCRLSVAVFHCSTHREYIVPSTRSELLSWHHSWCDKVPLPSGLDNGTPWIKFGCGGYPDSKWTSTVEHYGIARFLQPLMGDTLLEQLVWD